LNITSIIQNLSLIWSHLEWYDFLDVIFVWIIIYKILTFIRGTGAVQILTGLAVVTLAYITSIWLELSTLHWVLKQFFDNLFLIIIVLFQGDIRRALAHIGKSPFLGGVSANQEMHVLEELSKGTFALASKGYGALIVLEREIGLDNYIQKGTDLNAEIRAELLLSIFHPEGPLHDGAILIRGGRVISAGSFLPLSKNPNLAASYGTRHRAALGISEDTDALVIIVSEERKTVAVAEQGEIKVFARNEDLMHLLIEAFQVKAPRGGLAHA